MDMLVNLLKKYREVISYLFFGAATTAVNFIVYWFATDVVYIDYMVANVLAWVLSVLFAYVTNRRWVFESAATGKAIITEMTSFFGARVFTGLIDMVLVFIGVQFLAINDILVKAFACIIVIILNYILSKCMVFKKKKPR